MHNACRDAEWTDDPIGATRHYHHRWETFRKRYLAKGVVSPLGKIARVWYRQEDQARGSLHVHAALWIVKGPNDESTCTPEAIRATAPRKTPGHEDEWTDAHDMWRSFVLNVQRHDCRPKCKVRITRHAISSHCYPHHQTDC